MKSFAATLLVAAAVAGDIAPAKGKATLGLGYKGYDVVGHGVVGGVGLGRVGGVGLGRVGLGGVALGGKGLVKGKGIVGAGDYEVQGDFEN